MGRKRYRGNKVITGRKINHTAAQSLHGRYGIGNGLGVAGGVVSGGSVVQYINLCIPVKIISPGNPQPQRILPFFHNSQRLSVQKLIPMNPVIAGLNGIGAHRGFYAKA